MLCGITYFFEQVTFDIDCEVLYAMSRTKTLLVIGFPFCAWKAAEPW